MAFREQVNIAYCGPFVFGLYARATPDAEERERALARGREVLSAGPVGTNALDFYACAIEANLTAGRWSEVRDAADALERSTAGEPLAYSSLLIRRARLLAAVHEGSERPDRARFGALSAEIRASGFFALLPALEPFL